MDSDHGQPYSNNCDHYLGSVTGPDRPDMSSVSYCSNKAAQLDTAIIWLQVVITSYLIMTSYDSALSASRVSVIH